MTILRVSAIFCAAILICPALPGTEPNAATRRWWSHVVAMSKDDLEGRDAGSVGHQKAARYVGTRFARAGLKPAGQTGYYQSVPLHEIRLRTDRSNIELAGEDGIRKVQWLRDVTIAPRTGLPEAITGDLVFVSQTDPADDLNLRGKIVVQLSPPRMLPRSVNAVKPVPHAGIVATISIDNPGGPEPPHWPVAYSRAMTLAGTPLPAANGLPVDFVFNHEHADMLLAGSGHTYKELAALAAQGKPLPHFTIPASLRATMSFETRELASENVVAVLPGSDPVLSNEVVVLSAHLDGYGIGEPRDGDRIYNGAFDDAAYVATLIDFAEHLKESGTRLKRSLLFAVVTAEEKGLLGSRYFVANPTIPKDRFVANINLDQLRPIFPLKLLTTLALDESTLGDTVKAVAAEMEVRIRPDPEPERGLLRRSDHINFMQLGVPAVGFIFGYENGSPEEVIYRRWYAERYHSPADDLNQPWVPEAAAKFNEFFGRFVTTVANAAERPRWKPDSTFVK
ncbi:MAG: hypothetical protein QOJ99_3503, partial [Bryobacterales bacterium]|nr:hypothetical protein [Bryobacterales bacterium]